MITAIPQPEAHLLILADPEAVAREAARRLVTAAGRAVEAGALCRVALSGGRTPLQTYRILATDAAFRDSIHWPTLEIFWGDERFVPHDHPDSNYGAAREALLDRVPLEQSRVHPIPVDAADPGAAAEAYEATLRQAFGSDPVRLDLVLLGLGPDGHTASLVPGARPPEGSTALVAPARRPEDGSDRVTFTPAALNAARQILFLVTGREKAEMLQRVMRSKHPDPSLPATWIRPARGTIGWLADRAAAEWVEGTGEENPAGPGTNSTSGDEP